VVILLGLPSSINFGCGYLTGVTLVYEQWLQE
jgi:hypothetical protein